MFTVLFVDDSRNIREFCRRELEKDGYKVLEAPDGQVALDICGQERPDIMVLDLRMPVLDGLETVRRVRDLYPELPVILHTAHLEDLPVSSGPRPVFDCVEKTRDLVQLKSSIARALTHRPPASPELG